MNTKKLFSMFLLAMMLIMLIIPSVSANNNEITYESLPELKEGYNRYYFLMPDEWYNEYTDTAGIYWFEGPDVPTMWPGYKAHKTDVDNVYYYDVPKDVPTIIWNNFIDGGKKSEDPMHEFAEQTTNIAAEYYLEEESEFYPEGVPSFNQMIYVTGPEFVDHNSFPADKAYGEWFYYYGEGEYGVDVPEHKNAFEEALDSLKEMYPDSNYGYADEIAPEFYPELFANKVMPWGYYNMLYAHNGSYEATPDYVVFEACTGGADQAFITEQFGDYLVTHHERHSVYELAHFVYVPTEQKVYTLKEAYEKEDLNISEAFTSGSVGRHRGDANLDSEFNIKDATYIQKYLAQFEGYENTGFMNYDGLGDITIKDVTAIQKSVAGII